MCSLLIAKERLQDRVGEHAVVGDRLEAVERLLTARVLNERWHHTAEEAARFSTTPRFEL
jgi:hypothetical protein